MKPHHEILLAQIRMELVTTPELAAHITNAMIAGLESSARSQRERAADMETVAYMAMDSKLFKGNGTYITTLLKKWQSRSALNWDGVIEKLDNVKGAN